MLLCKQRRGAGVATLQAISEVPICKVAYLLFSERVRLWVNTIEPTASGMFELSNLYLIEQDRYRIENDSFCIVLTFKILFIMSEDIEKDKTVNETSDVSDMFDNST